MSDHKQITDTFVAIRNRLLLYVRGIVPPKEVEDIVQETYVRLCLVEDIDQIREPHSFMFRTARNLAFDYIKRAENRLSENADQTDQLSLNHDHDREDHTFTSVVSEQEFGFFCEAVRRLPKQCRRAFVLKKVYGYSLKEIAEIMDIGLPTVDSHIVQGTKKCVLFLRDKDLQNQKVSIRTSTTPLTRSSLKSVIFDD